MNDKNKKVIKIIAGTLAGLGAVGGGAAGIALALDKGSNDSQHVDDVKPLNPDRSNNPNAKPGMFDSGFKVEDKYGLNSFIKEFTNKQSENKSNKKEAETFLFNVIEKMLNINLGNVNSTTDSIKGKVLDFASEMVSGIDDSRFLARMIGGSLYLEKISNNKRATLIINPNAQGSERAVFEFEDAATSVLLMSGIELNLTSTSDVINDGIPNFIKTLGSQLLTQLFKSRIDAISSGLASSEYSSLNSLTKDAVQDLIAKEAFDNIYSAPIHVIVDNGTFDVKLGDILLSLTENGHGSPSIVDEILASGTVSSDIGIRLFSSIQSTLKEANRELGREASYVLLQQLAEIVSGGNSDALKPIVDSLSEILPSGISFGLKNSNLSITGLLTNVSSLIIKDIYKINDAAGISLEDLEQNPEYRRIIAATYAYRLSLGLIKQGEESLAGSGITRDDLSVAFNAANGGSVSYEQFQAFKDDNLDGQPGAALNYYEAMVVNAAPGSDVAKELLGYSTSGVIDLMQLAIPELQFGRGAGQLGQDEKDLASNISMLLNTYSRKISEMVIGENNFDSSKNHASWVATENKILAIQNVLSIVSVFATPVVDGHYQMSGMNQKELNEYIFNLGFDTIMGHMGTIINNSNSSSGGFDDFDSSPKFDDWGDPIAPKTPEQQIQEMKQQYLNYLQGKLGGDVENRLDEFLLYNEFQTDNSTGSQTLAMLLFQIAGAFM